MVDFSIAMLVFPGVYILQQVRLSWMLKMMDNLKGPERFKSRWNLDFNLKPRCFDKTCRLPYTLG